MNEKGPEAEFEATGMLVEGQELWYVPADERYRGQACAVRVLSVGKKWAKINRCFDRVDIKTLWIDGGKYSSPGRCWLNKEAWEAEERRLKAWAELRGITAGYSVPDIPEDTIRAAIKLLSGVGESSDASKEKP